MVSFSIRHVADTAKTGPRVLASRVAGVSSGHIIATRRHFGLAMSYQIDEQNGSARTTVPVVFPDAKYAALDYTPARTGYRFLGWYDAASGGSAVSKDAQVVYDVPAVYAQWQDHVAVTFDATTNGGAMPAGWTAPYYFAGQPYGTLPVPTHPSLTFLGWYVGDVYVNPRSAVADVQALTLVARYGTPTFSVDTSLGEWELDTTLNPDPTVYAGVYKSVILGTGSVARVYINVAGYDTFRVLIASNSEPGADVVVALALDRDVADWNEYFDIAYRDWETWETAVNDSGDSSTYDGHYDADPSVASDYLVCDYQLDGHPGRICILYAKDEDVTDGDDRGYMIIPLSQQGGGS